jgi:hypothetical protein
MLCDICREISFAGVDLYMPNINIKTDYYRYLLGLCTM